MASALDMLVSALPAAATAVAGGDVASALSALGREQVGRVELRSQFTPPVVVNDPLAPSSGPPAWWMRLLKPEARVYDPQGNLVVAVAPAGEPTENYFIPSLVVGGLLVLGAWVAGSYVLRRIGK